MSGKEVLLKAHDLGVRYGDAVIVDKVDFEVSEGDWLMIAGPNGAGKSTIVGAIAGGVSYTGSITCLGKDIKAYKPQDYARIIGVLAQKYSVGYSFTVEEVVRLGRYAYSRGFFAGGTDEDDEAIDQAIERTGLVEFRNHSVLTLSGGELQRTFLAQIFAQNPRILILDEPTNHLDLVYQKQVFALIGEWLKEPGRAVVSVVHDLSLAKAYGTRAMLLDKGRSAGFGEVDEVLCAKQLDEVYDMDVYEWMKKMLEQWK